MDCLKISNQKKYKQNLTTSVKQTKNKMKTNKLTVILILTVLMFTTQTQYHDWYQDYWHMDDWNNIDHMDPFNMDHMGNMQPHDGMNPQKQHPNHNNNQNNYDDQINPYFQETIAIIYFICFIVLAAINVCLLIKCLKKRAHRKAIQEQMRLRRISFATLHGFDTQTLNDPRYSNTIHL